MKSYVWLTFGFMGWAYYEMSGGSDFVPVEREVAEVVEQIEQPELVARAETTTLLSVSTSNVIADPIVIEQIVELEPEIVEEAPVVEVAAVVEPKLDIREVANNRVNMRMGPGTNYDVITTLNPGTKLEILEVDAEGWANVSTVDRGIEGWMAERLLTAPEI